MLIAGYQFEDPKPLDGTNWNQVPAVYVILDNESKVIEENIVIDVGETDKLRDRLENHERGPCWEKNVTGEIFVAAKVVRDGIVRQGIESDIKERHNPPCGKE